jgi:hypothetical protein
VCVLVREHAYYNKNVQVIATFNVFFNDMIFFVWVCLALSTVPQYA